MKRMWDKEEIVGIIEEHSTKLTPEALSDVLEGSDTVVADLNEEGDKIQVKLDGDVITTVTTEASIGGTNEFQKAIALPGDNLSLNVDFMLHGASAMDDGYVELKTGAQTIFNKTGNVTVAGHIVVTNNMGSSIEIRGWYFDGTDLNTIETRADSPSAALDFKAFIGGPASTTGSYVSAIYGAVNNSYSAV